MHKVSIIMPVLNGERYIAESVESILAQTYKNYELIVINDGSTDSTAERLQSFAGKLDLKVIRHETRQGVVTSMNDGLRAASGDYIAFLDHDDAWFPNMLETEAGYLDQVPEASMVHSDFQTIDSLGNVIEESVARCRERKRPTGSVFRELFLDSFIVGNSVLIRKQCFEKLGDFDRGLIWGDYHMWLRVARHYRVDYIPKVLVKYRQHSGQETRTLPARLDKDPVAITALKKILEAYPEVRQEIGEKTIRHRMASIYFGGAYYWFEHRAYRNVRMYLAKAIPLWPGNSRYYLMYAASLLTPSVAEALRGTLHRSRSMFSSGPRHSGQWKGEMQGTSTRR
jgi:glycosyltransferase involved in cell wall biosynthesis